MKIAEYKRPSDWELFFKHRTNYIPLKLLEHKFNRSIDFTILRIPQDIENIDGTKDIIIINLKEYYAIRDNHITTLEKQARRSFNQILILGDCIKPDTECNLDNPNFHFAGTWFESPVATCEQTVEPKKYLFDFLIGYGCAEFDYLYDQFDKHNLFNPSTLYNYRKGKNPDFDAMDHKLAEQWRDLKKYKEGESIVEENSIDIDLWVKEFGTDSVNIHNAWTSRIVPQPAYQQSLFSVVRETEYQLDRDLFYQPTEKTAKPLLCKRLFFTLGAQFENQNYKNICFLPYDDENNTWDHLEDWKDRTDRFAEYIATLDQDRILYLYEQEKHKIEHNYKIATQDWGQMCLNFVIEKLK